MTFLSVVSVLCVFCVCDNKVVHCAEVRRIKSYRRSVVSFLLLVLHSSVPLSHLLGSSFDIIAITHTHITDHDQAH